MAQVASPLRVAIAVMACLTATGSPAASSVGASGQDNAPGQPEPCSAVLTAGWHKVERDAVGWFRWTERQGQIRLVLTRPLQLALDADVASLQRPNAVTVGLGGKPIAYWGLSGAVFGFTPQTVQLPLLQPGSYTISLVSDRAGVSMPSDARLLSVAVRRLRVTSADRSVACKIVPDEGTTQPLRATPTQAPGMTLPDASSPVATSAGTATDHGAVVEPTPAAARPFHPGISVRAILPIGAGLLLLIWARRREHGWREAGLCASLEWAVLAVLFTEGLSLVGRLSQTSLAVCWTSVALVTISCVLRAPRQRMVSQDAAASRAAPDQTAAASPGSDPVIVGLFAGAVTLAAIVLLVSVLDQAGSADRPADSIHWVAGWLRTGGVDRATDSADYGRHLPLGLEYLMLQLDVVGGSDRLDALVPAASFITAAFTVSLVAAALGASALGQSLAGVMALTIPQGVSGIASLDGDRALALWLAALVYFLLRLVDRPSFRHAAYAGCALGLMLMTGAAGYLYGTCALLVLVVAWPRPSMAAMPRFAPVVVGLALLLNSGIYCRSISGAAAPGSPGPDPRPVTQPVTQSGPADNDQGATDARGNVPAAAASSVPANPWHVGLVVLAGPLLWLRRRSPEVKSPAVIWLATSITLGVVGILSGWQPGLATSTLPVLAAGSAPAAIALAERDRRSTAAVVATLLLMAAMPFAAAALRFP